MASDKERDPVQRHDHDREREGLDIAVIGIAGRFPGAGDCDAFWRNLRDGVESIATLSEEDLTASGVPARLQRDRTYVKRRGVLEGIDLFDAAFFSVTPREAELMDPQQRLFLECAWETFEHAGYDPQRFQGAIGCYAGSSSSGYLFNLFPHGLTLQSAADMAAVLGVEKDSLPTRVSYKLNLEGPSVAVQTACSTSLVAVHLACQGLLAGECEMALAGGISINVPQKVGYLYQKGGIASPDGHCRTFDADARGTVGGSGVGLVLLKRLEDAQAAGDHVLAVIKGSAVNNDGAQKVGYTAPRIEGQAKVIQAAQAAAGVEPDSITYVEAHGTATPMGDPIEVAALTQAFRAGTDRRGFCALGSVKTNIGHLDAAAGIAGLIKAVLALSHRQIPPSLHFSRPNPEIAFAETPFYVNEKLADWARNGTPRRAGVSSFGLGGTNAHVVLEEAPLSDSRPAESGPHLFVLSARSASALSDACRKLAARLGEDRSIHPADVSYTLQEGRRAFAHRRWIAADTVDEAVAALGRPDETRTSTAADGARPVVFLFSGQGSQYPTMGVGLYRCQPVFREQIDRCAELLVPHVGGDIRPWLFEESTADPERLDRTAVTQPALFALEYALARLWMSLGVQPQGMIGHSIGEYVAACLSGVFSLEDALSLVALRGRLMQALPAGAMLAVSMPEAEAAPWLREHDVDLAAVNAPNQCVWSGPIESIDRAETVLAGRGIQTVRLRTSHAFHSRMMDPILESFRTRVGDTARRPPTIPWVSNVTGEWISTEQATDPRYWTDHLRQGVRFADGIRTIRRAPERVLLEVGPGQTLCTLAQRQIEGETSTVFASLSRRRRAAAAVQEATEFLDAVGRLWGAGVPIEWSGLRGERAGRVPLPTYPFERRRFWVEPAARSEADSFGDISAKKSDSADWLYRPSWKRAGLCRRPAQPEPAPWLVFLDDHGAGAAIVRHLEGAGSSVIRVSAGDRFERDGQHGYRIRPGVRDDYQSLVDALRHAQRVPRRVAHCWNVRTPGVDLTVDRFRLAQDRGFHSLVFLTQALGSRTSAESTRILVLTTGLQDVTGDEELRPALAPLLGVCRVAPQEYANLAYRTIDLEDRTGSPLLDDRLIDGLLAETQSDDPVVAYRGSYRWVPAHESVRIDRSDKPACLRMHGVYLITGGLGGVGLALADYLFQTVRARLVLVGRSKPSEEQQRSVDALRAAGAEILVLNADVADAGQMRTVAATTRERFGAIHGVVHAAGIAGGGLLDLKTVEASWDEFAPKVAGALVLDEILRDVPLDFLVFCSSLNALTGGVGQAGYCGANAALDALAHAMSRRGLRAISVNFDRWNQVGMAAKAEARLNAMQIDGSEFDGMTAAEGLEVFARILENRFTPQVMVSVRDLSSVIAYSARTALAHATGHAAFGGTCEPARPGTGHTAPVPGATIEEQVAFIWKQIFGIEQVELRQDFFALGGESLAALQILNRVQEVFGVEVALRKFFEAPTVAGLAAEIRGSKADGARPAPDIVALPRRAKLAASQGAGGRNGKT
ncbi:putative Polyketide synthase [Nitrospira japonica]|uniref:Putative Polyketide synthase n=1 Tax=Nitrospira japonica TaxID=1325564 RepID=A0A1W1IAR6_9BACT|nr:type I polyketide synthase [Nitrospira japonica]SLM50075.1 putative Polyketide synthase [Nitrospira japonica]